VKHILPRCLFTLNFLLALLLGASGCDRGGSQINHSTNHNEEQFERGPHNGRLLRDGNFSLEITIFEQGVPPQLRVYGYHEGVLVRPQEIQAQLLLKRLGDKQEEFILTPVGDFLTNGATVSEPHSFQVEVRASYSGKESNWRYDSFEGRTTLSQEVATHSGIQVERPVQRMIATTLRLRGKIVPSEHRIAHVIPRFSGIVREGRKHIGDRVDKGEVLAIIESNQSLQPFEIRSQISGTVINGHLIVGEFVPDNQWVYIVADLSEVWADFFLPIRDRVGIKTGQKVQIGSPAGDSTTQGAISYLAPYADERSQAQLVRAVIPNGDNTFLPGMFITGDVVLEEVQVPVAVRQRAVQRFRDWDVVFVRIGDTYEARPVELGRSDHEWVEVTRGLAGTDEYVVENAFVVKADILKAGASHDH